MGEIAEGMLDGTLCQCCGVYLENSLGDFPQYCPDCAREAKRNKEKHEKFLYKKQKGK